MPGSQERKQQPFVDSTKYEVLEPFSDTETVCSPTEELPPQVVYGSKHWHEAQLYILVHRTVDILGLFSSKEQFEEVVLPLFQETTFQELRDFFSRKNCNKIRQLFARDLSQFVTFFTQRPEYASSTTSFFYSYARRLRYVLFKEESKSNSDQSLFSILVSITKGNLTLDQFIQFDQIKRIDAWEWILSSDPTGEVVWKILNGAEDWRTFTLFINSGINYVTGLKLHKILTVLEFNNLIQHTDADELFGFFNHMLSKSSKEALYFLELLSRGFFKNKKQSWEKRIEAFFFIVNWYDIPCFSQSDFDQYLLSLRDQAIQKRQLDDRLSDELSVPDKRRRIERIRNFSSQQLKNQQSKYRKSVGINQKKLIREMQLSAEQNELVERMRKARDPLLHTFFVPMGFEIEFGDQTEFITSIMFERFKALVKINGLDYGLGGANAEEISPGPFATPEMMKVAFEAYHAIDHIGSYKHAFQTLHLSAQVGSIGCFRYVDRALQAAGLSVNPLLGKELPGNNQRVYVNEHDKIKHLETKDHTFMGPENFKETIDILGALTAAQQQYEKVLRLVPEIDISPESFFFFDQDAPSFDSSCVTESMIAQYSSGWQRQLALLFHSFLQQFNAWKIEWKMATLGNLHTDSADKRLLGKYLLEVFPTRFDFYDPSLRDSVVSQLGSKKKEHVYPNPVAQMHAIVHTCADQIIACIEAERKKAFAKFSQTLKQVEKIDAQIEVQQLSTNSPGGEVEALIIERDQIIKDFFGTYSCGIPTNEFHNFIKRKSHFSRIAEYYLFFNDSL